MPNRKKPTHRPTSPDLQSPTPQRPETLRRRISSGFNSLLSNLPLRRSTPQQNPDPCPQTVPNPDRILITGVGRASDSQQAPIPQIRIPLISDPEEPCPYDTTNYQSFPSVERSRCDFCGMRPPSKAKSSEPCNDCRSKSPFSHLRFVRRKKSALEPQEEARTGGFTPGPQHSPSSSEDMIRIVPAHIAANRIGNPPRTASLPPGISRLGSTNTRRPPAPAPGPRPPNPSPGAREPGTVKHRRDVSSNTADVRPLSPKLHYLHGLPNSKAYPYVRKSEVAQHIAAIAAGSPSPLADVARAARQRNEGKDMSRDFSKTVFYGNDHAPGFTVQSEPLEPRLPRPRVTQPGTIVVEELLATGRVVVNRPGSAQTGSIEERLRRSPEQRETVHRLPLLRTRSTGLRVRGGSDEPKEEVIPRLRGGSGDDEQRSCSFLLKQCLLTCPRNNHGSPSSDEDLPPARTPNPAEIARAMRRASGTAKLPKNISRHSPVAIRLPSQDETSRTASFAAAQARQRSVLSHFPLQQRREDSPLNQPFASLASPQTSEPRATTPPPVVGLRGGAGSPSALRDHERLPAGLFWLAGGRGKPITAAAWKAQKPKKRMGGLVGVALYGTKAGMPYVEPVPGVVKPGSVKSAKSAAAEPTAGKAESMRSNKIHSSKSSTKSRSSKSSSSSRSSKSSAGVAKEEEGQRDAPLDPVPEEGAATADAPREALAEALAEEPAAPVPYGEPAAEDAPVDNAAAAEVQAEAAGDGNAAAEGGADRA
jgi:hypothetical protein